MKMDTFRRVRILVVSFVSATMAIAVVNDNIFLALGGVLGGMLFLTLVRRRAGIPAADERVVAVAGRAGRATYAIMTIMIGLLSLVFTMSGQHTGDPYIEALGSTLSYTALLSVGLYAISYKYYSKKYGADDDDE